MGRGRMGSADRAVLLYRLHALFNAVAANGRVQPWMRLSDLIYGGNAADGTPIAAETLTVLVMRPSC